jgi:hypothetical protein
LSSVITTARHPLFARPDHNVNLKEKPLMKAAVVHQFGRPLRIEDVPVTEPGVAGPIKEVERGLVDARLVLDFR